MDGYLYVCVRMWWKTIGPPNTRNEKSVMVMVSLASRLVLQLACQRCYLILLLTFVDKDRNLSPAVRNIRLLRHIMSTITAALREKKLKFVLRYAYKSDPSIDIWDGCEILCNSKIWNRNCRNSDWKHIWSFYSFCDFFEVCVGLFLDTLIST